MKFNQLFSFLSFSSLLTFNTVYATTYKVPNHANTGAQTVEYTAKSSEFDGQKITPYPNSQSYEWLVNSLSSFSTSHVLRSCKVVLRCCVIHYKRVRHYCLL